MDASKESCRKARLELEDQATMIAEPQYKFIHDFLDAAEKKLPMQSSIDRDRASKRRKAGRVAPVLPEGGTGLKFSKAQEAYIDERIPKKK